MNDVSSLFIKKKKSDEINKGKEIIEELKICEKHSNEYLNSFCVECFQYVCKKCMEETLNEHHCHRILSCSKLKQTIKNSIEQNLFLRYN